MYATISARTVRHTPNYTGREKNDKLKRPKTDSKVTTGIPPQSDSELTQT